jgi:outer membrane protein OmpA-like peptidoglycan-associated protein
MSDSTYHYSNDHHRGDSSSYTFWTWLIAIIVAIYLFWAWQHGRWPAQTSTCCTGAAETVAVAPFNFSATADRYESTGDPSTASWASKSQSLVDWLKGGSDWKIEGNASSVTLTGTVDSEATKAAKGAEAQAFFGDSVTINNQLTVSAAESPAAVATAPSTAKIYFDTAKSSLPAEASQTLAPIIAWVKNNPDAKVVISGYHDSRGNKASNLVLAKKRAGQVLQSLTNAGIAAEKIELRKPQNVEGDGSLDEARRAEISVE